MRQRKILKVEGLFMFNIAKVYCYHYEFIVQKSSDFELVFVDVHKFLQGGVALIIIKWKLKEIRNYSAHFMP